MELTQDPSSVYYLHPSDHTGGLSKSNTTVNQSEMELPRTLPLATQGMPQLTSMGSVAGPPVPTASQQAVFPPGIARIPPPNVLPQFCPGAPSFTTLQPDLFPPGTSHISQVPRFYAHGQGQQISPGTYAERPFAEYIPHITPMGSVAGPPVPTASQQAVFPPGIPRIPPPNVLPQFCPGPTSFTTLQPGLFPPGTSHIYQVPRFYAHGQQIPSGTYAERPFDQYIPHITPMMESCSSLPSPYPFPPNYIPPKSVQPQPHSTPTWFAPQILAAVPNAFYSSTPILPSSPAPKVNRAHDSDYWGEKAREWAAAQDSLGTTSEAPVTSPDDFDYSALLARDDLVFPLEVPICPWMKMELVRMTSIASPTTTEKKDKVVNVSVEFLSKILDFIQRFNPDRSPHKYEVSPSKPFLATPPLPPTSQAPPASPLPRTADASDSSRSRRKRHRLSIGSGERSKRPKPGEG